MKKRVIATSFASVLAVATMGVGVFAETIPTGTPSGTSDVSYITTEGYTITIPANFTLTGSAGSAKTATGNVSASSVLLQDNQKLTVSTYSEAGALTLNGGTQGSSTIAYTIQIGSGTKQDASEHNTSATEIEIFEIESGETSHDAVAVNIEAADITTANLAGNHKDTLTFVVDVASTVAYMQDIDATMKASIASGDITTLRDRRDNNDYYVAKIGDDYWMTQNLDYVPTGATWATNGILAGSGNIYTDGTASTTDGTDKHFSQGSYYDWTVANTVCPTGWELPSKAQLEAASNGKDATSLLTSPFYVVRAGYVYDGELRYVGDNGYYWSSTEGNEDYAYYLYFRGDGMRVSDGNKAYGFSVRCVAK